ncbi:MAG: radical SAM protein [Myxococcales bacterium FL481]|nr:MAG: radical SAM protein [Myxococcales bacterium FL481]
MTYVYPVVSRRAGGVSIGINLNPNNACNFRCIYCQVPQLWRGPAPPLDLDQLEAELRRMLADILDGDFMRRRVPEPSRQLKDIAFSGNGEPTASRQFALAVNRVGSVLRERDLVGSLDVVLITNGSFMHRAEVQAGLEELSRLEGQIWFKIDAVTDEGRRRINDTTVTIARARQHLAEASRRCRTRLQTCLFTLDGVGPSDAERAAFVQFVVEARRDGIAIESVLLYGPERPSLQPEAPRIGKLSPDAMQAFAAALGRAGVAATVH